MKRNYKGDYIKRILAKAEFTGNFQDAYPTAQIHALPDTIPAADVREVVKSDWEWNDDNGYYYCGILRLCIAKGKSRRRILRLPQLLPELRRGYERRKL